jgi:hypothetical protein
MRVPTSVAVTVLAAALAAPAFAAPLGVVSVHPSRQRIDVPANGAIQIEFNAFVDAATVNATAVRVFGRWSGPATGTIEVYENTITFQPSDPFFAGEYVTVSLSRSIKNTLGEAMSHGYAWSFWIKSGEGTLALDYLTRYDVRQAAEGWVQPYGAYAGDLNHDGWSDLFVPCERTDDVRVFMNNGAGLYPGGFAVKKPLGLNTPSPNEGGDFDNDGDIDVVVTSVESDQIVVMFGDGTGAFPTTASLPAGATQQRGVGVLDLNGDGWDDIVSACRLASRVSMFLNNGDGTFAPRVDLDVAVASETSIAVADANNDGILDVFLGNYTSPCRVVVLLGNGNGGLVAQTPVATSGQPWMLVAGDFNGDGNVDVCSANSGGDGVGIHFGNGTGGISAVTTKAVGTFPLAVDTGDIDGDGDLDLVSSDYGSGTWTIWENNGTGTFVNPHTLFASSAGSCATLHDRDNDGDLDLTGLDEVDDWVYLFVNNPPASSVTTPPVESITMSQNRPNPFNPSTTIHFELARGGLVNLSIYDASGALVATIVDGNVDAGPHDVRWNGTDARDQRLASGVYFYRLTAHGTERTRKMMLLK